MTIVRLEGLTVEMSPRVNEGYNFLIGGSDQGIRPLVERIV